jgi:hypothetical protein
VVTGENAQHAELILRMLPLEGSDPRAVLDELLRSAGQTPAPVEQGPTSLYKTEHDLLGRHTLVPLLDLPRGYAVGSRVRDLRFDGVGLPDLAGASLRDVP